MNNWIYILINLNNEPGLFPNHIPNPEDKEAMKAITQAVLNNKADLGIIFDTDVDRFFSNHLFFLPEIELNWRFSEYFFSSGLLQWIPAAVKLIGTVWLL